MEVRKTAFFGGGFFGVEGRLGPTRETTHGRVEGRLGPTRETTYGRVEGRLGPTRETTHGRVEGRMARPVRRRMAESRAVWPDP